MQKANMKEVKKLERIEENQCEWKRQYLRVVPIGQIITKVYMNCCLDCDGYSPYCEYYTTVRRTGW